MLQKLRNSNEKGFTLIELMIVIAIIGILAAIAIPNFIAYRNKSYCSRAESDGQNVLAAIACYFAEPENRNVPSYGRLDGDRICDVEVNEYDGNKNEVTIYAYSGNSWQEAVTDGEFVADNIAIAVKVSDASELCPRRTDAPTCDGGGPCLYTTFMGTELRGAWMTEADFDPNS